MAALALQPHLAEFLDEDMHDDTHGVRLEEIAVPSASSADGRTLLELQQDAESRSLLVALRHPTGRFTANPDPQSPIRSGDVLVALGSPDQLGRLRSVVSKTG